MHGEGGAIGAQEGAGRTGQEVHRKERGGRGNRCTGRSGEGGAIGAQEGAGK